MFVLTLVCIFLIWYLSTWFKWWKNVFRPLQKIPGPTWYPIFGNTHLLLGVTKENLYERMVKLVDQYQPLYRSYNGTDPEVNLTKAEHMEVIFKSSTQINKGRGYTQLIPWLGEGLLISRGPKWFLHRKLITPTFHFKILENFMDVFVDKSKLLVKQLELQADGKYHNIYPNITHCALDIICETAMGVTVNAMSDTESDYIKSIYEASDIIVWRALRPWLKWDPLFHMTAQGKRFKNALGILHGFSNKVIADRRKLYHEKKISSTIDKDDDDIGVKKRLSFLDILLDASEEKELMTETDLREEVDTFIFEGHDTTTAAMCWSLFLLGNYPEIQEKAYEEIANVLGEKSTPTTLGELSELKYLECVIKEALRLYPSVPFIMRSLTEEVEIGGYKIPAGTTVTMDISYLHRSPEQFADPDKFDPDRFLPENSLNRHPYAYAPFSAGPRNCIGQKFAMYEEKTILASILNAYKIVSKDPDSNVKIYSDLILRPQNGVHLKLEKRIK